MKKENKAMKEKIYDARTGLEYVLVDDYYLPPCENQPIIRACC